MSDRHKTRVVLMPGRMQTVLAQLQRQFRCVALIVGGVGFGLAVEPAKSADTVYACVPQSAGAMRFVSKNTKCKRGERKWSWSAAASAGLGSIHGRLTSGCSVQQPGDPDLDAG